MKLKVNPLVVAAALGLLGPAALVEDEESDQQGIAGVWKRSGEASSLPSSALGDEIHVVPFEDSVVLDDGVGGPQGTWQLDEGPARQQLCVDGRRVTRTFAASGDRLDVHVTVESSDGLTEYRETFIRTA